MAVRKTKKAENVTPDVNVTTAETEVKAEKKSQTKTKKTASVKETVENAVESVKKTVKKPAKKAEPVVKATVECFGKSIVVADIVAKATDAFKATNSDAAIETLELYIKPEENAAYYVVNGEGSADYRVEL